MAMNKKEQAEFEALRKAVYVARALNWTQSVAPDIPAPKSGDPMTRGFVFNVYSQSISHALSSTSGHATGCEPPTRTSTQHCISMYSTKLLALKALRHEVEKKAANDLAKIDMQIEAEALLKAGK